MRCLDYANSFVCSPWPANAARFWIESRTRLFDDITNTSADYYQCAACKSERTFAERNLFVEDNYDFTLIFGGEYVLVFRRTAHLNPRYREITTTKEKWGTPIWRLREAAPVTVLDTWEKIRDATTSGLPIVTQTEIVNTGTRLRAIIECPTKTMNVSLERELFQVDTGPIAFPDLTKRHEPAIACFNLAFIAFNAPGFADFVIEQPTPVIENGEEVCSIHHYSGPFSLPAKNTVMALGTL